MTSFQLTEEFIELNKLLKLMNLCSSGGEANHAISDGKVKVDGVLELRKRCKLRTGQKVTFQGKTILIK